MTTLAKDIRPKLRGPRYRKARRRLRRQTTPGVTWMHPIEFEGLLVELSVERINTGDSRDIRSSRVDPRGPNA